MITIERTDLLLAAIEKNRSRMTPAQYAKHIALYHSLWYKAIITNENVARRIAEYRADMVSVTRYYICQHDWDETRKKRLTIMRTMKKFNQREGK